MASDSSDLARLRVIVSGRVQGVFFRQSAADKAHDLGVTGFARNLADGSVEIVAEGARPNLEMLLAWTRHGPPRARVDDVRAQWSDFQGKFRGFAIR